MIDRVPCGGQTIFGEVSCENKEQGDTKSFQYSI